MKQSNNKYKIRQIAGKNKHKQTQKPFIVSDLFIDVVTSYFITK